MVIYYVIHMDFINISMSSPFISSHLETNLSYTSPYLDTEIFNLINYVLLQSIVNYVLFTELVLHFINNNFNN